MKIGNGRGEATPGQRTQLPAPRQGCQRRRGELDQCSICDPHRGQNCRLHPVFDFLFVGVPASAGLRFAKKPPEGGTPAKKRRKSCLRLLFSSLRWSSGFSRSSLHPESDAKRGSFCVFTPAGVPEKTRRARPMLHLRPLPGSFSISNAYPECAKRDSGTTDAKGSVSVKWMPPGQKEMGLIPNGLLFHTAPAKK